MEKREPARDIARKLHEASFEELGALEELYRDDSRKQVQDVLARAERRHEK